MRASRARSVRNRAVRSIADREANRRSRRSSSALLTHPISISWLYSSNPDQVLPVRSHFTGIGWPYRRPQRRGYPRRVDPNRSQRYDADARPAEETRRSLLHSAFRGHSLFCRASIGAEPSLRPRSSRLSETHIQAKGYIFGMHRRPKGTGGLVNRVHSDIARIGAKTIRRERGAHHA